MRGGAQPGGSTMPSPIVAATAAEVAGAAILRRGRPPRTCSATPHLLSYPACALWWAAPAHETLRIALPRAPTRGAAKEEAPSATSILCSSALGEAWLLLPSCSVAKQFCLVSPHSSTWSGTAGGESIYCIKKGKPKEMETKSEKEATTLHAAAAYEHGNTRVHGSRAETWVTLS
ncbi:uncharacterized protein O8D03_013495 [Erethizon dorsatum]